MGILAFSDGRFKKMNWLHSKWRSLWNLVASFYDLLYELLESFARYKIGKFVLGGIVGVLLVLIYWGYACFFYINIPLTQAIVGSLILILFCAITAVYGDLARLIENLWL
jgi:uncharacterized MnhB-related membrane protein